MAEGVLPDVSDDSELARWSDAGHRIDRANIVTFVHPDETFVLEVAVDDPIQGYLVRLWSVSDDGPDERVGQAVVEDPDLARRVATELAGAAEDLVGVHEFPSIRLDVVDFKGIAPDELDQEPPAEVSHDIESITEEGRPDPPEGWNGSQEEWAEVLEEAYEEADIPRTKGTVTEKTIDGRDYYYLQWREGESVRSQYVAPVNPSS